MKQHQLQPELVSGYKGDRKSDVSGITYGAELNLTMYFSGGFYISLGTDWNKYPVNIQSCHLNFHTWAGNTYHGWKKFRKYSDY